MDIVLIFNLKINLLRIIKLTKLTKLTRLTMLLYDFGFVSFSCDECLPESL